ncbi:MAG TPA: hypothetical protein P5076_00900 [Myxococcota bacterium]|nr:hypothetical protein [Myxococcota bacterium]
MGLVFALAAPLVGACTWQQFRASQTLEDREAGTHPRELPRLTLRTEDGRELIGEVIGSRDGCVVFLPFPYFGNPEVLLDPLDIRDLELMREEGTWSGPLAGWGALAGGGLAFLVSGAIGLAGADSYEYGEVLGDSALIALAAGAGSALIGLVTGVVVDQVQQGTAELETLTRGERIALLEEITGLPGPEVGSRCRSAEEDPGPAPASVPAEEPAPAPAAEPAPAEEPAPAPAEEPAPAPAEEPAPAPAEEPAPAPAEEPALIPAVPQCPQGTRAAEIARGGGRTQLCVRIGERGIPIPHGPSVEWFANGGKAAEGEYLDGAMHGPWTAWHPGGGLRMHALYDHGRRCGIWTEYDPAGEEQRVVEFAPCAGGRSP